MSRNRWKGSRPIIAWGIFTFAVGLFGAMNLLISGKPAFGGRTGLVDDWSTHHVIFSNPGTAAQALAEGRIEQWYRTVNDPRYIMQQAKRSYVSPGGTAGTQDLSTLSSRLAMPVSLSPDSVEAVPLSRKARAPHRDWAVTLGTGTVAENMYPAKFTFNPIGSPNCSTDYAVFGLNVAGTTGSQANMVAFNELYSGSSSTGCTGYTQANPYWAYNVSYAGGKVTTSPVLSENGDDIIFVESGGTTGPYLHVLVWNSADGGTAVASKAPAHGLTGGIVTSVGGCTAGASCLVSILLNSTTETITNSSPFYDYTNDIAYVGDDAGNLYKVHPVLGSGTPAVTKYSFGLTVGADTSVLTGPTYDASSGYVFVGASNGEIYAVTASTFNSTAGSYQFGDSSCSGGYNRRLTDPPIVDSARGWVYEYVTADTSPDTAVLQATTSGPFTTKNVVTVGQGDNGCNSGTFFPTHSVTFDNNYYTGTTGASGTIRNGHIWVCGRETGSAAELWDISTSTISGSNYIGSISGVTAAAPTTQIDEVSHAQCSPITEIYNSSTDYIFMGEGLTGSFGRLYGMTITDPVYSTAPTATEVGSSPLTYPTATGGTSAIIIDNTSATTQASSIYFTTQATSSTVCTGTTVYCAVKLTQSALQ
jgi:hypothetical protein